MTAIATRAPARRARSRSDSLAGTGTLVRFILRRDRIRMPVWILALTLGTVGTASSFPGLYPTAASRQARAALLHDNPAGVAFSGPGYGLDDYTLGAMMTNEMLGFIAILVALMSVLLIVRHTRAEEETDRAELVRAAVVGRHAHLTAALVTVGGANLVLGLLVALTLGGSGIGSLTWAGSIAFGAALTAVGLVFAGIAAVAVQVTEHARAASGMAGAMIGVAFVLRAAGDISSSSGGAGVLSWLSPIGWAQATRAYVDERWWPLGLAVLVAAAVIAGAYALSVRRDVGAGMLPQRQGSASASTALGHPVGLAVRLQRGTALGWGLALLLLGLVYGSLISAVQDFISENEAVREAMISGGATGSLTDSFLAMIVGIIAMVSALYAVQATLRLRSEESAGRAEPLLATGLSRIRWVGSHLAVALVGGSLVLVVSGLGLGASAAVSGGDTGMLTGVLGAALVHLPALWVTVGVAVALVGLVPRAAAVAWLVPVYALIVGTLGGLLQLPDWLADLSPFTHVPQLPGADLTWTPLIILTVVAAALIGLGLLAFRRRDVSTS